MRTITVLGEGAFGSAIAQLLAGNGHQVTLWCHDPAIAQEIKTSRTNTRYLPEILTRAGSSEQTTVHQNVQPTTDLAVAAQNDLIVAAIPVKYLRGVLQRLKPFITPNHRWVLVCKGIEEGTHFLPTQIIADVLGSQLVAYLAGPSFAHELASGGAVGLPTRNVQQLTAVMFAGDQKLVSELRPLFENSYFKIYPTDDLQGVQLCAALKNVLAIGMGIINGLTRSDNTQAFFLTRALEEMATMLEQHKGKRTTVYGLAGVGDLVLSSLSVQGRNMQAGRMLGMGPSLQDVEKRFGVLPEGFNTLKSIPHLIQGKQALLLEALYKIVYEKAPTESLIKALVKH